MNHLHHKVSALVDGELQGAARRRALAHVRSCEDCQRDVAETLALKQRLGGLRASEPSADLFASLDAATRPVASGPPTPAARPIVRVRRLLIGAGSVSVAVLSIAYVVGSPTETATAAAPARVDDFSAEFAASSGVAPLADPAVQALSLDAADSAGSASGPAVAAVASPLAPETAPAPGDEPEALRLVQAAAMAPTLVAYAGVRRISSYDGTAPDEVNVDVLHIPAQGTRFALVDNNGDVGEPVFVSAEDIEASEAVTKAALLQGSYDLAASGHETVAGRRAAVIDVGREGQLTARLWIDAATGILLRRDVYADGRVARSSAFIDFALRPHAFLEHVPPTLVQPSIETLPIDQAAQFNDSGWTCPDTVMAGWQLLRLDQVESMSDTLRATYSDGLSSLAIYEQRGALDPANLTGFTSEGTGDQVVYRHDGLPTQVVWESNGMVYTVVTDAPAAVVDDVLADLPRDNDADGDSGFGSRVGSGLDKMVEFLSPVG